MDGAARLGMDCAAYGARRTPPPSLLVDESVAGYFRSRRHDGSFFFGRVRRARRRGAVPHRQSGGRRAFGFAGGVISDAGAFSNLVVARYKKLHALGIFRVGEYVVYVADG